MIGDIPSRTDVTHQAFLRVKAKVPRLPLFTPVPKQPGSFELVQGKLVEVR